MSAILVGVAEDGRSDPAMAAGAALAESLDAELRLVHATPRAADAEAATRHLASRLGEHAARLIVREGHPAAVLLEVARELVAGLIVVGEHRREGLFDLGRTARGVVAHAPCPVWAQAGPPREVRRVLVPVDLSEDSRHALEWARELARTLGATTIPMHCYDPPTFAYPLPQDSGAPTYVVDDRRDEAREEFEAFAGDGERRFVEGVPSRAILEAQEDADLIVMATHGRNAFSAAVLGSVTYAVMREAERPVVAVRHPGRT